ncbi:MAG: glycosyltransferase family 4 protein [Solirubrobacteraceae bacterium]
MRIQLWSYNFEPEPIGIGPVSATWARAMVDRGHEVEVVAAHPHYPSPQWGTRLRPYRERRFGISVLRLPIWVGRGSTRERLRQEASFAAAQLAALPVLPRSDVVVSVSPCFFALGPAMLNVAVRRVPWVLWLQDLLPDAAAKTGLLSDGLALRAAQRYERAAYQTADEIVLISESHRRALLGKGVDEGKLHVITNPTTLPVRVQTKESVRGSTVPRILNMGNIGLSQGLAELVRTFEASSEMRRRQVEFRFAGDGVEVPALREEIRSDRVKVLGVIPDTISDELEQATIGLVSQLPQTGEFNMPSRLMNFLGHGIPVLAVVGLDSEVARVVRESGGGWVIDATDPNDFPEAVAKILDQPSEIIDRGHAARMYADGHFSPAATAAEFELVLEDAVSSKTLR